MQIEVPPPSGALWFLVGLPLVVLLVSLAFRGRPLWARLLPGVLVAVVSAVVASVALRPLRFAWDERGIRDGTFGEARAIPWGDVRDARVVRDVWRSPQRPARRTHGTYYSGYGSGTWTLADGRSARVFFEPAAGDALVFTAAGETYLYAPRAFDRLLAEARAHVGVAGP